jgi:branched-chain amino acid transport system substrate-binding protein
MMSLRRCVLGAIVVCVAFGAATASAGRSVSAKAGAGSVSCTTSATIGYMGPTTGPVASIGEELRDWPLLYVSQWNATHKLQIKVVEGDDQFDPSQASTIAQQFASNSTMLGVLGPGSSTEVEAAAPLFKRGGMPYIAATATNSTLTNGTFGHFYRIAPPDSAQAQTTANYMVKTLKAKKVAIFDDQSAYSKPLADTVQGLLKKMGVSVFRSSVSPKATDYSSTITTIPDGTDLIYTPFTNPANMQLFGQQMVDQGKNIAMFAGDSGYSDKFHIVGAHFSTFAPDIRDLPADKPIIAAYFKKEGSNAPLTTYGPPSYVSAQMLIAAVAKACADGKATRAEVNADLHKVSLKTSLLGHPIKFTSKGEDAGAQFVVFVIGKDGKPTVVQT